MVNYEIDATVDEEEYECTDEAHSGEAKDRIGRQDCHHCSSLCFSIFSFLSLSAIVLCVI